MVAPPITSLGGELSVSLIIIYAILGFISLGWLLYTIKRDGRSKPRKLAFLMFSTVFCYYRVLDFAVYLSIYDSATRVGVEVFFAATGTLMFYLTFSWLLFIWTRAARPTKPIKPWIFYLAFIIYFIVLISFLIAFEIELFLSPRTGVPPPNQIESNTLAFEQENEEIEKNTTVYWLYYTLLYIAAIVSLIVSLTFFINTIIIFKTIPDKKDWKIRRLFFVSILLVVFFLTRTVIKLSIPIHSTAGGYFAVEYYVSEIGPLILIIGTFLFDELAKYLSSSSGNDESHNSTKKGSSKIFATSIPEINSATKDEEEIALEETNQNKEQTEDHVKTLEEERTSNEE